MTVYLVGAGPGDPGLITVRGAEVLRRADVVFYDRLAAEPLLHLAPPQAERIAVGKTPRGPSTPQEEINRLLVEHGSRGATVVRLKGGDPFVFGRGSEEAAALRAAGVAYEVVPGVTSAVAAPAYAGVPVTSRGVSKALTIVTGQGDPWAAPETDWDAVARLGGTIVLLMAVANRAEIASRLQAAGLDEQTPVAAVTAGTRADQVVVRTTLGGLGAADVEAPATIVIGAVAGLDLSWFAPGPLGGRRVALTRPRGDNADLAAALRALGAEPVEVPVVAITPAGDGGGGLAVATAALPSYDWVVFTSANAVDAVFECITDARDLGGVRVAAVGDATATSLRRHGIRADVTGNGGGADLAAAIPDPPARVLVPQAAGGRAELTDILRSRGFDVDMVEAYRTAAVGVTEAEAALAASAEAVVFASPSAVAAWEAAGLARPRHAVCIGPTTAAAADAAGFETTTAAEPSVTALVDAVRRSLGS